MDRELLQGILDTARASVPLQQVPGGTHPFALVPEGYDFKSLEELIFNQHAPHPERIKQNVKVFDPASFVEYYTQFHDANSRTFADEQNQTVHSVLDYHGAAEGGPRWCQHTVSLELRLSKPWQTWLGYSGRKFTQEEFAEFLEQNSMDITDPSPAAMMETATDLRTTTDVEFGAGIRTQDGQVKFKYSETTKSSVGTGNLEVPDKFTLTLPVYVGGERVSLQALLRFRVNQGKLVFFYVLVRPEDVVRNAFIAARDAIAKQLGITIINGTK